MTVNVFDIFWVWFFLLALCKDWKAAGRGARHQWDAKCISTTQWTNVRHRHQWVHRSWKIWRHASFTWANEKWRGSTHYSGIQPSNQRLCWSIAARGSWQGTIFLNTRLTFCLKGFKYSKYTRITTVVLTSVGSLKMSKTLSLYKVPN